MLTPVQQNILVEIATGPEKNTQAARRLGMTIASFESQLVFLYRKTGTCNKVQLLRWALRNARKIQATLP